MFDLHAVELGRPVPIPAGHGFDDRETGVVDAALDAAVMAQGDFTGDEFLEELEMAAAVASGLFGGWRRHFRVDSSDAGCGGCPADWSWRNA